MKQQLLDTLEQIAGKENIHPNEPMSRHTTFRVGGPADYFVAPHTEEEIRKMQEERQKYLDSLS